MSLLMEGSTVQDGKYQDNLTRAVEYLLQRVQRNGQIGNLHAPGEAGRYMHAHGYALLFLSCVYSKDEDCKHRDELGAVLERAVKFSREAQTRRTSTRFKDKNGKPAHLGGWGYIAAGDGNNFDEGPCAITNIQALHAARRAGIPVPPEALEDADNYLREATGDKGGILYSLSGGGGEGRAPLTAGE